MLNIIWFEGRSSVVKLDWVKLWTILHYMLNLHCQCMLIFLVYL